MLQDRLIEERPSKILKMDIDP